MISRINDLVRLLDKKRCIDKFCGNLLKHAEPHKTNTQFGAKLSDVMELKENVGLNVPKIVTCACKAIQKMEGFDEVGIFRISCQSSKLKAAISQVEEGNYDFSDFDSPHVPAVLLKTFFKEMKEPIIPISMNSECADFGAKMTKYAFSEHFGEFEDIVKKIPKESMAVLTYLALFLCELAKHKDVTRMDLSNLCLVFTPTLTRITEVLDINALMAINENLQIFMRLLFAHLAEKAPSNPFSRDSISTNYAGMLEQGLSMDSSSSAELAPPPVPGRTFEMGEFLSSNMDFLLSSSDMEEKD